MAVRVAPHTWVTGNGPQTHFHVAGGAQSDVTVCDSADHEWHLHKSVLTFYSKFFAVRFDASASRGAAWDSVQGALNPTTGTPIITLPNESPDFTHAELSRMFRYMYTANYGVSNPNTVTVEMQLIAHSRCFALGDRFDVPGLKDLAVQKFRDVAAADAGNAQTTNDLAMWARVIDNVYSLTTVSDLEMRNVVVERVAGFEVPSLLADDQIQEVMEKYHDLAVHMVHLMGEKFHEKSREETRYREYFMARGAWNKQEEDELMAPAFNNDGW